MMLIARRGNLALAVVVDIALHARPEPVAAKALAERFDLPPRHLEPLLQTLVRAGILRGIRGPKGGYELARERRRMKVADVLRASLEDPGASCQGSQGETSPPLIAKVIVPLMTKVGERVLGQLETVTIEDLCARAMTAANVEAKAEPADFTI